MRKSTAFLSAAVLTIAAGLAGCNKVPEGEDGNAQAQFALPALPATIPMEAGAETAIATAPSASDLPDAPPLKLAQVTDPSQNYGYADAAYSYEESLGDAPPDYAFDYDGTDPWAWQGYDDSMMVAEPIDDGYRYYYYRPGATEPYFVRDPWYSYAFAGGLLAMVYGADGGIVPYADYGPRLTYASRYYARGRGLFAASRRGRRGVIAGNWARRAPVIVAARNRWGAGRMHQPAWQTFYQTNRPRQQRYWQTESVRRQADSRRFADWRQQGFRNAAPPRAIPVAWERARWAQDDRRYRPAAEAIREARQERRGGNRAERAEDRRDARQQAQQDRRQDALAARRDQAQQQRQQAQQERRQDALAARRDQAQDQRQAQQQQRQQAQQQRQAQQREAQQQRQAEQAQARRAQQAEQMQRRQAEQAQQRQAQQAERRQQMQAEQAQRRQAEAQQRQAERQQQMQAQRQQAQQAERQRAQESQRQQMQQQRQQQQQQMQQQRQQMQQQRQQQRQERREGRGN